ncbi:MAG: hypothetical protein ACE1ZK_01855 [Nitrospirales bacterium]
MYNEKMTKILTYSWLKKGIVVGVVFSASIALGMPSSLRIQIEAWSPYYSPALASVLSGTLVRWENPTATHHTVTHDGCNQGGSCLFDSGAISPYGMFELPELPPGYYPYHCTLHPIMRGVLVVTDVRDSAKI